MTCRPVESISRSFERGGSHAGDTTRLEEEAKGEKGESGVGEEGERAFFSR